MYLPDPPDEALPIPSPAQPPAGPSQGAPVGGRNDNLSGALLMVASTLTFVGNDTVMKFVSKDLPLYEAMALRGAFVLMLLVGYALWRGKLDLRVPRRDWGNLGWRSLGEIGSSVLYLLALMQMPLANLSAIVQALPLLVTLAAAVFFGEKLGAFRLGAIGAGFVGVLVILRPGTAAFDIWSAVAVVAVLALVLRDMVTRRFSSAVSSTTISVYAAGGVMLFALAMAPTETWRWPSLTETGLVLLSAALITIGYVTAIATMRVGEVSFVAPFRYTALIWAILLGLLVFGDWPDAWTWAGSALVVGAGVFTILRERRVMGRL